MNKQREKGMNARDYANAKRGGFSLSERVWNLQGSAYKEMEIIIQNGILEGQSAAEISRGVRGHLNNPKALFRSVRVKDPETGAWTGEYRMSKAAQAYHPGQGVYRSAYQNALRMARTEVNQAYRTGEWSTGQDNPLIKGYEIKLSGNHTTRVKTKKGIVYKHLHDVCDDLAGIYPKSFRWGG